MNFKISRNVISYKVAHFKARSPIQDIAWEENVKCEWKVRSLNLSSGSILHLCSPILNSFASVYPDASMGYLPKFANHRASPSHFHNLLSSLRVP